MSTVLKHHGVGVSWHGWALPTPWPSSRALLIAISGPLFALAIALVMYGIYLIPMPSFVTPRAIFRSPQVATLMTEPASLAAELGESPLLQTRQRWLRLESSYADLTRRFSDDYEPRSESTALHSLAAAQANAVGWMTVLQVNWGGEFQDEATIATNRALTVFEHQLNTAEQIFSQPY